jgi:hypothetical protein
MKRNARKGKRFRNLCNSINSRKSEIVLRWASFAHGPLLTPWLEGSYFTEYFHSSHCWLGVFQFKTKRWIVFWRMFIEFPLTFEGGFAIDRCSQVTLTKVLFPTSLRKGSFSSEEIFLNNFVGFCWIWYRDSHCLKRPRWEILWRFRVVSIECICRSLNSCARHEQISISFLYLERIWLKEGTGTVCIKSKTLTKFQSRGVRQSLP